ncbi:MAG: hypothetical protein QE487_18190 [Fluviicola sp.]|nr:hypothetical protein [Fluviicola sp.]
MKYAIIIFLLLCCKNTIAQLFVTAGTRYHTEYPLPLFERNKSFDYGYSRHYTMTFPLELGVSKQLKKWFFSVNIASTNKRTSYDKNSTTYTWCGGDFQLVSYTSSAEVKQNYLGTRLQAGRLFGRNSKLQLYFGAFVQTDWLIRHKEWNYYYHKIGISVSTEPFRVLKTKNIFAYFGVTLGPRINIGRVWIHPSVSFFAFKTPRFRDDFHFNILASSTTDHSRSEYWGIGIGKDDAYLGNETSITIGYQLSKKALTANKTPAPR